MIAGLSERMDSVICVHLRREGIFCFVKCGYEFLGSDLGANFFNISEFETLWYSVENLVTNAKVNSAI